MSELRAVNININDRGVGSVKVGDADLTNETVGATIVMRAGRTPHVQIDMIPGRLAADTMAEVQVDPWTSAALIELGWTPPGGHTAKLAESEFVLTWHPIAVSDDGMDITDGEPVEIPLGEPWVLPGTDVRVGEFRLSAREVPPADEPVDVAELVDLLSLVPVRVSEQQVAGWTDEQRQEAARWAGAVHLSASDNDDVEVPPRPTFLDEVSGG